MKLPTLLLATAIFCAPAVANAEMAAELPSAVSTFKSVCLAGGMDSAARPAALSAAGWSKVPFASVDVAKLNISKAIDKNYDFAKPDTVEQWTGTIDDRAAIAVLASYPANRRYPHLCGMVVDGISNAMPYSDELKAAFKDFGIGGKSVDLVHYFEYAGKVGADKHPVRGEIFTRSLAGTTKNTMHLYVAY